MSKSYKERAKALRSAGLLDKNIDLRKTLTPAQKSSITQRFNNNKSVLNHLQDFAIKYVSKETARGLDVAALRTKTKGGKVKVYIPNPEHGTVRVKKGGRVQIQTADYEETVYKAGKDLEKTIKKVFKKKLGPKEYVTARFGKHNRFSLTFDNPYQLLFYLNAFEPKDDDTDKDELFTHLSITRVRDENLNWSGDGNVKSKKANKKTRCH